jgi:hypothetical protein
LLKSSWVGGLVVISLFLLLKILLSFKILQKVPRYECSSAISYRDLPSNLKDKSASFIIRDAIISLLKDEFFLEQEV